jgi:hypothetical protein
MDFLLLGTFFLFRSSSFFVSTVDDGKQAISMELRRALVGVPEESRRAASVIGDLLREVV